MTNGSIYLLTIKQMEKTLDDYINGNLSDFRRSIKWMSKYKMLDFIEFAKSQGIKRHQMITTMRIHLEIK